MSNLIWIFSLLSVRSHGPRNASGTGSGKNRFHVRDESVLHGPGQGPGSVCPGYGPGCNGFQTL